MLLINEKLILQFVASVDRKVQSLENCIGGQRATETVSYSASERDREIERERETEPPPAV